MPQVRARFFSRANLGITPYFAAVTACFRAGGPVKRFSGRNLTQSHDKQLPMPETECYRSNIS